MAEEKPKQYSKQHSFVEIPQNLGALSVKELNQILDALGARHEDCFEKNDLIARIEEHRESKRGQKKEEQKAPTATRKDSNKENRQSTMGMPVPEQICLKIISVGNSETGKSCLIKRYCEEKFVERYIQTIGIDYGVKKLKLKSQPIAINFFDMSGNEEYKGIRTEFYGDVSGVVMVFDLDNRDSYNSLIHWEEEMKKNGVDTNRVKVVVCGNKSDSKGREVNSKEA